MIAPDTLGVAMIQTTPHLADVDRNLADIEAAVRTVAATNAVDLAVTAELASHGYFLGAAPEAVGLATDDERLLALGRLGPAVVVGILEACGDHRHNAGLVLDDAGVVGVQRKLYPVDYQVWNESALFRPGRRLESMVVRGAPVAVLVCNDVWQPPLPWLAAHAGAEVLVVIADSIESESTTPVQHSWDLILRHAAVTLQSYVVFVNRTGIEAGHRFWGESRVLGPDGQDLARLGSEPGQLAATLDLRALRDLRAEWPMLRDSRYDVLASEIGRRR